MADRFPLIVNETSRKIEELISGDNLNLTGNGIILNGDTGTAGQYLKSIGSGLDWDNPGDVYLTASQTVTNKTFETCTISGSTNFLSNIPNTALVNPGININGSSVSLGGAVTTPDNNTTYSVSATDGANANEYIIRLTSGGNSGAGINDDVTFIAGSNVTLSRVNDEITIDSSFTDTDTVTRLASGTGGSFVSGDVTIAAGAFMSVGQVGGIITVTGQDTDTITRVRAGTGGTLTDGDFTFIGGSNTTITQSSGDITIDSDDTVTRVKGGGAGSFSTGDIEITGSGDTTVSQSGNTITINSTDADTITRVRGTAVGTFTSGDLTLVAAGATSISQSGTEITISSTNTDTNYAVSASGGLSLTTPDNQFEIKNADNLSDNTVIKWDNANNQLISGIIEDDGSTVTIGGDLVIEGTTTTVDSTTIVVADNELELRKGQNLVGTDGGIRLNRTSDGAGAVQTYSSLQWFESGAYWRVSDGSVNKILITDSDTQTLTNKTLTSPTLTSPSLGAATATSINGLQITSTVSGELTVQSNKTFAVNNSLTFQGTDSSTVSFNTGGTVAYTNVDTVGSFQQTTSNSLQGVITDSTGSGSLTFATAPVFTTSLVTNDSSFDLFNTGVTTINAFGAATTINMGVSNGNTNIVGNLDIAEDATFGSVSGDTFTVNGITDFVNNDIIIRGSSGTGIRVGTGNNDISTNTAVGYNTLGSVTTGGENTAYGYLASQNITTGASNTSVGYQALPTSQSAADTVAIGQGCLLNTTNGVKNTAVGNSAGDLNETGSANVFLGYFAGFGCQGSGNVIIGPADTTTASNSATYAPVNATGDRQLVIGSGADTWIRGDASFNIVMPQGLTVGSNLTIGGNFIVNGTTTTVNSSIVEVVDKTLELASVTAVNFDATVTDSSADLTNISTTSGLIVGMGLTINTAGITVQGGGLVRIQSINIAGNTITLDKALLGSSGTASFTATGPNDFSADGSGIIIKGDSDHTLLWEKSTAQWEVSEHFQVPTGKEYRWNGNAVIKNQQIGPSTTSASWELGSDVVTSSLTSVGTLTSLAVSGNGTFSGTGYVKLPAGDTDNHRPASPADGMLRFNTDTKQFEGYATDTNDQNGAWGKIGGGATMSASTPSGAAEGDLWYDTDDGRLYIYYNDGSGSPSAQWVDASPSGTPTDLVVDGTTTLNDNTTIQGSLNVHGSAGIGGTNPITQSGTYSSTSAYLGVYNTNATKVSGNPSLFVYDRSGSSYKLRVWQDGSAEFSGDVTPASDATQDLGSATNRWANIYSADLQLSNEGAANDVDGTWGQYTIQEGEDDLFLINRRNGKTYKFNLTEVA